MVERGKITDYPAEPENTMISQILKVHLRMMNTTRKDGNSVWLSRPIPDGDEEWANQMEVNVSTRVLDSIPKDELGGKDGREFPQDYPEWIVLFDLDYVPIEDLRIAIKLRISGSLFSRT